MLARPSHRDPVHRYDLISCHECGTLHRKAPLGPRQKAGEIVVASLDLEAALQRELDPRRAQAGGSRKLATGAGPEIIAAIGDASRGPAFQVVGTTHW